MTRLLAARDVYRRFRFLNRKKVLLRFYRGVRALRFRNYQGKHAHLSRATPSGECL